MDIRHLAGQPGSDHYRQVQPLSGRPQMNLGNKLAVGEAVAVAPSEPVAAHAER